MSNLLLFFISFIVLVIALSIVFNFWFYLILGGVVAVVLMFLIVGIQQEYGDRTSPVEWGETIESTRQSDSNMSRLREKIRREWDEFDLHSDDMR